MDELRYMLCPQNHSIAVTRNNFARDSSDESIDADGRPMFEGGLYCIGCDRPYGLTKLREHLTEAP